MNKFQVGDVLRVRLFDDLAAEFGVDEDGCIPCDAGFVTEMRKFCGQTFTVKDIDYNWYIPEEIELQEFCWSADMLERIDPPTEIEPASEQDLNRFLTSVTGG